MTPQRHLTITREQTPHNFSSIVWREENLYVAWCPDLDIASQGKTIEESLANLKEAIELHLQDEEATTPKRKPPNNNLTNHI